jgi:hypothetical protein
MAEKLAAQVLAAHAIQSEADGYKAELQTSTEERVKALEEQRPAQSVSKLETSTKNERVEREYKELENLLRQTQEHLAEKTKLFTHLQQEREREKEEGEVLQRGRLKRERERDTRERLSRNTMEKFEEQLLDLERSFDLLEQAVRASSITFEEEPTVRGADITEKIELIKPQRGEAEELRRERGPIAKQVTQLAAAQASMQTHIAEILLACSKLSDELNELENLKHESIRLALADSNYLARTKHRLELIESELSKRNAKDQLVRARNRQLESDLREMQAELHEAQAEAAAAKSDLQDAAKNATLRSLDLMEQFNMLEQIAILTDMILNQGHGHLQVRIKAWENAERDRPDIIAERMLECEKWDCERQQYVNRIQEMEQEGEACIIHLETEIDRLLNKVL